MRRAGDVDIAPPIGTKVLQLSLRGFLFVVAMLGGGKASAISGKHAAEVARGGDTPPLIL